MPIIFIQGHLLCYEYRLCRSPVRLAAQYLESNPFYQSATLCASIVHPFTPHLTSLIHPFTPHLTSPGVRYHRRLQGHSDFVKSLCVHGKYLYSGSSDKKLKQWDLETGKCIRTFPVEHRHVVIGTHHTTSETLWFSGQLSRSDGSYDVVFVVYGPVLRASIAESSERT